MKLFTAFDIHYASPAIAMFRSIATTNRIRSMTVLSVGMTEAQKRWIQQRAWLDLEFFDVSIPENLATSLWFTPTVYARLLGPALLNDRRLLYMDPDVLVVDDLTPLSTLDMKGHPVAAAQSIATPTISSPLGIREAEKLGLNPEALYLSAGVLLIDRDRWIESDITDRSFSYATRGTALRMADQEALNYALNGNWQRLHLRWNQETGLREPTHQHRYMISRYFDKTEVLEATLNPGIVHFNGPEKPWRVKSNDRWSRRWLAIRSLRMRNVEGSEESSLVWPVQA